MTEGFIVDITHGARMAPRWIAGAPERSWGSGIKTKGKECRWVATYRCTKCGLLRSYANEETKPPTFWQP
jgi:hypothetical protein